MFEFILKNKEWIFSGIGVTVILGICYFIRYLLKRNKQSLPKEVWHSIDYQGKCYAWDGPLERLSDGDPIPTPNGLEDFLKGKGMELRYAIPGKLLNSQALGFSQLFEIDLRLRRKRGLLAKFAQVLLVRKTTK